ncbi:hypothetical protein H2202_005504 [Exophiala xenobiotica]|nr:hypothetical protein H2202_005504 [Exophiala xenobiotica]KAK5196304.1 hypothetical protein LTR92_003849 [Exophiala xenobiotica]KAK5214276.1 hypothetical protein LTR41_000468 [Exophiala xenobiotica]KAK5234465.1 hypothetical protein LTR47_004499 [Exophiala xenobiotica]KAK5249810.1 hypothetical protein LTS06_005306 [Exophiala xenobiotica]
MPRAVGADDEVFSEDSDIGDINHGDENPADAESKTQLNGELHDNAEEAAQEGSLPARAESEDTDASKPDGPDEEYVVEAIQTHRVRKGVVEYHIKWVGYAETENTWEPEDHLLPHARKILANYHKAIGGAPGATSIKRSQSRQSLKAQSSADDTPEPKRRKKNGESAASPETEAGTWTPKGDNWEAQVDKVETIERNQAGQLTAFVLFKNGKKSIVSMEKVYAHCPRPMLKFYEEHLKFKYV